MRLTDIEVDEISLVDKAANKRTFLMAKRDPEAEAKEKAAAEEKARLEAEAKAKAEAEKVDEFSAEELELVGKILDGCDKVEAALENSKDSK